MKTKYNFESVTRVENVQQYILLNYLINFVIKTLTMIIRSEDFFKFFTEALSVT